MYNPQTFFNIKTLEVVLSNYNWPCTYILKEIGAGNISLQFPKCTIVFSEGFESKMNAYFLNSETKIGDKSASFQINDAVKILKPIKEKELGFKNPIGLKRFLDDEPSEEKVKEGLNNICILLQTYLLSCILGDFSWLDEVVS